MEVIIMLYIRKNKVGYVNENTCNDSYVVFNSY